MIRTRGAEVWWSGGRRREARRACPLCGEPLRDTDATADLRVSLPPNGTLYVENGEPEIDWSRYAGWRRLP